MDEVAKAVRAWDNAWTALIDARQEAASVLQAHLLACLPDGWDVSVYAAEDEGSADFWFFGPGGEPWNGARLVELSPLGEVLIDNRTIPEFLAEVMEVTR